MPDPVLRFGWVPDVPDIRDKGFRYAAAPERTASLPASTDLTSQCPPIYDQGDLGSCTANAIAAAMEFDLQKNNQDFMPARLFIYYNERAIEHTVSSDSGAQIRDGIRSVAKQGVCPETEWPYVIANFTERPSASCYADARKFEAILYQSITQDLDQLKACLAEGYPFVFGFSTYRSLFDPSVQQTGDIPLPKPGEPGTAPDGSPQGHAVMAVGYDDSRGVFLIRNSWGTGWGKQGYGSLPYDYLTNSDLANDFWTIRNVR